MSAITATNTAVNGHSCEKRVQNYSLSGIQTCDFSDYRAPPRITSQLRADHSTLKFIKCTTSHIWSTPSKQRSQMDLRTPSMCTQTHT